MYPDMQQRLTQLEKRLGITFNDQALLLRAVTHRSYLNENRGGINQHNELLEFLGDAALGLAVAEHLVRRFPSKTEGELTTMRSKLVRMSTLAQIGYTLQLEDVVLLSRGERSRWRRGEKSADLIVASAVEAIIGAMLLDQGIGTVRLFLDQFLHRILTSLVEQVQDHKPELQEVIQERHGLTPHYEVVREEGPSHDPRFMVAVFAGTMELARGQGRSKRAAEEVAAERALAKLNAFAERLPKRGLSRSAS